MRPNNKQLILLKNRQTTCIGQMNNRTADYYKSFSDAVRDSKIPEQKQEELLLDTAKRLVEAQKQEENPESIYGRDPQQYIKQIEQKYDSNHPLASDDKTDETRGLSFNVMIAWAAISIVLLLMGFVGLVTEWGGQDPTPYTKISLFTLTLIAGGSIVLIQVLLSFNNGPEESEAPVRKKGFQLGSVIKYLLVLAIISIIGYMLGKIFPVIQLSSITLLIIGIIGLVLMYPLFIRNRKK